MTIFDTELTVQLFRQHSYQQVAETRRVLEVVALRKTSTIVGDDHLVGVVQGSKADRNCTLFSIFEGIFHRVG